MDLAESGTNSKTYEGVAAALREAAQEAGDSHAEARALVALAYVHHITGRFDPAREAAAQALELAAETDHLTSCWASNTLGVIALYQNHYDDGEAHLTRAIESFRACHDRPGEASALCNLSRIHLAAGRTSSAVSLAQQGTDMYDDMGHALKGANGRYALGLALTQSGRLPEATARLSEALTVFRNSRQRLWEDVPVPPRGGRPRGPAPGSGGGERRDGPDGPAGHRWRVAQGNVLIVLGQALNGIGHSGRAQVCWRESSTSSRRWGHPRPPRSGRSSTRSPSRNPLPQDSRLDVHHSFIAARHSQRVDPSRRGQTGRPEAVALG